MPGMISELVKIYLIKYSTLCCLLVDTTLVIFKKNNVVSSVQERVESTDSLRH